MPLSPPILDADLRDVARLQWCVSVFGLLLVMATWPLWCPAGEYPLIPWFWMLWEVPASVDRTLTIGIVLSGFSVAVMTLREWMRSRPAEAAPSDTLGGRGLAVVSAVWLACLAGSVMLDQQRFQVWAWEFFWLTLFLNLASPRVARWCCRVLLVSIYVYSAVSKLDLGFFEEQGPWLWQGLRRVFGGKARAWGPGSDLSMLAFPAGELLVAGLLCFTRSRRWGVAGAWVMHLTLWLALGPLGWNQKPGVLLWNLFFLLSVPLLFWGREPHALSLRDLWRTVTASCSTQRSPSPAPSLSRGDRVCVLSVLALSVWPALEGVGLCDHWPAWAVYSSRPEIVTIQVSGDDIALLPKSLQPHIGPPEPLSGWRPVSIDQWSFDQRDCPVYPQARYRLAVARHLEATSGVTLRVIEHATAWRSSRHRPTHEFTDLVSECHDRYWFNTQSRNRPVPPPVVFGDRVIAHTAQLAVACYAIALLLAARQRTGSRPSVAVAVFWTAGLLGLAIHVACAFHFLHHWSHAAALKHTAQRTAAVTGWDWPGGLYINYAFLLFWAVDAVRVWREAMGRTTVGSAWRRRVVHGVFLFMMFNATVVFGPWHWTVVSLVFAVVWWIMWRIHNKAQGWPPLGFPHESSTIATPDSPADDRPE